VVDSRGATKEALRQLEGGTVTVTRVRTRSRGAPPLDAWHDPPERLQPIRHLESWPWTWQRDARDPQRGLAPTLQQITDAAKQLFGADGAGLMLVDAEGQLRWASASDQTAQNVEDGQERLAQGPCAVAFSQRLPAAIRNIKLEPDWQEFAQVLVSEGICAALSVPVELDGEVIGTLDIYVGQPRDWDPSEVAALQAYAGLVASLLNAATTAQVKGRLADQLQAALEHRWLIEQAKGVIMGREELDAQAAFERLRSAARSSTRRLADVAKDVTGGQPLPADRQKLARARAGQAKERETAPNGRTDGAGTFVPGQPVRQRPRPAEAAARRAKRQPRFGI
jgi:GAF domain-containing protein